MGFVLVFSQFIQLRNEVILRTIDARGGTRAWSFGRSTIGILSECYPVRDKSGKSSSEPHATMTMNWEHVRN